MCTLLIRGEICNLKCTVNKSGTNKGGDSRDGLKWNQTCKIYKKKINLEYQLNVPGTYIEKIKNDNVAMSDFNKAHFLSHESNLLMMSTAGPLVHSQYHQRQRLRPLHKCGETNFRKNISSPFGRPDVTRPKITTHARTHTSAHKQVPPPGGFLVLNRLACWDTA